MSSPEFKEETAPFPTDPNKYEINKWMYKAGLPVPRIFEDVKEAQEALEQGVQLVARGYFIDRGAQEGKRPFCADELIIDVLNTYIVVQDNNCEEILNGSLTQGKKVLTNPAFAIYSEQLGVDPADLSVGYFFQERIASKKSAEIRVLTANFVPSVISLEGEFMDSKFGNFYASEFESYSDYWWINTATETGLDLHRKAQILLATASGINSWHMEMVGETDFKDQRVKRLFLVQARRIPFQKGNFLIIENNGQALPLLQRDFADNLAVRVNIEDLRKKTRADLGIDLRRFPPYFLILTGDEHDFGPRSKDNRFGNLLGIIFAFPASVNHKLLSHNYYCLIALTGAKNGLFIISWSLGEEELMKKLRKPLGITRII